MFARVENIQVLKLPKPGCLFWLNILFCHRHQMEYSAPPALGCGTIEIKRPFNWRFITVKQGIKFPNPPLCFDEEKEEYHMNKAHDYYYHC